MKRNVLILVTIAALAACSSATATDGADSRPQTSTSQGAARVDTLSIRLNQIGSADGGRLEIRFDSRVADSRCPANVLCVWAGDAHVRISTRVAGGSFATADLHSLSNPQKVSVDRYAITMVGMTPYPGTGQDDATPILIVRVARD